MIGTDEKKLELVHGAVTKALEDLADAFQNHYWPVVRTEDNSDSNRINEANLTFYLAKSLTERYFWCFFEVPYRDGNNKVKRLDLLAINDEISTVVVAEIKGDIVYVSPNDLVVDYDRMINFLPSNNYYLDNYNVKAWSTKIAVQLCFAWGDKDDSRNLTQWWMSPSDKIAPPNRQLKHWSLIGKILTESYAKGRVLLVDWSNKKRGSKDYYAKFYGLYAIYLVKRAS